jgi:hypothetical protein
VEQRAVADGGKKVDDKFGKPVDTKNLQKNRGLIIKPLY